MVRLESTETRVEPVDLLRPRLKGVVLKRAGLALALWGEPGIGKSHAAWQLLREASCRSFSFPALVPPGALVRGIPRPHRLPAWAEPLLLKLQKDEALDGKRTAEALGAWLAALAPVVLHLEDLHEASPAGLEWIQSLATLALRTRGVALLVTSRVAPPEPFEAVRLEPLDAAGVRRLLEGEAGASLPAEAVEWIYIQAAGNPLFTLEYFRHLARRGFLWNDGQKWRWRPPPTTDVPLTVEALIGGLLEEATLEAGVRAVLEARAILPLEVSISLWAEVAGLSPEGLEAAQLALQRHGLMRGGQFAHPLFREVALNHLPPLRRQELARRALEALQTEEPQAAAAYIEASGMERKAALALLQRATQAALQAGNKVQAAHWMARSTAYALGEEQGRLALEAASVLQHHHLPEAARLVQLALSTPAATPETVGFYAHLLARQNQVPDLEALLHTLPQSLRETVNLPALAIGTYHIGGKHAQALATWQAHPELHTDPSPERLWAVAGSALAIGQIEKAQALVTQGLRSTDPLSTLHCELLSTQALIHYHRGEYAAAEATLAQALEILASLEAPRLRSSALLNRAAFLRMLGRYGEMRQCLEEALQIRRQVGDARAYAFAQAALAEVLIEQGRYEQAEEALSEALATLEPYGPSRPLAATHSMANLLYRSQDTPIARLLALRHAEQALGYARQMGNPRLLREVLLDSAFAQTKAGHPERALTLIAEAEGLAKEAGNSPHDTLQTLWARGLAWGALGDQGAAREALQHALKMAQELHLGVDEHKIGLELDRITANLEEARVRLQWFEERGLLNGAHLARRYFPALNREPTSANPPPQALLQLEVLGSMQWTLEGQREAVRGQKRKELLAALLEARLAGRGEVSKLELLDGLYRGEDEEKTVSSLKELIHSVRSLLGASAILTTSSGYALGPAIGSDVEAFLHTGDPRLWRGVYLEGLSPFYESVRESVYLALRTRAQALLEADPKEAARLGRILLEADPYDLEALRLTLEALRRSGNHKSLGRLYQEARQRMLEVGETLPEHWQGFLTL